MTLNNPESEPRMDQEAEGTPLDGRDGQPVEEGSSDDPRTLATMDPLRDEELDVDELEGHEAQAQGEPRATEQESAAAQADLENVPGRQPMPPADAAGARVETPRDGAGQEAGDLDALGRPLPEEAPEDELH